jgi:hypothetical protein
LLLGARFASWDFLPSREASGNFKDRLDGIIPFLEISHVIAPMLKDVIWDIVKM